MVKSKSQGKKKTTMVEMLEEKKEREAVGADGKIVVAKKGRRIREMKMKMKMKMNLKMSDKEE